MATRIQKLALASGAVLTLCIAGAAAMVTLAPEPAICGGGMAEGADIGGPFSLVSGDGSRVTEADLKGEAAMVYFGYATCPDICPIGLSVMAEAADLATEKGVPVRPVFITVDPRRDTPEVVGEYTAYFHPQMLGLTGTQEEVDAAAKAFKVYYREAPDESFPDGYAMDHSGFTYLMRADGGFETFFRHGETAEAMAEAVQCRLG